MYSREWKPFAKPGCSLVLCVILWCLSTQQAGEQGVRASTRASLVRPMWLELGMASQVLGGLHILAVPWF